MSGALDLLVFRELDASALATKADLQETRG